MDLKNNKIKVGELLDHPVARALLEKTFTITKTLPAKVFLKQEKIRALSLEEAIPMLKSQLQISQNEIDSFLEKLKQL